MSIAKGGSSASKIYLGSTEVSKIYKGDTLVYGGSSPVLPYDTEVEYLQSNGTPYIDSGIECTGDLSVEFEGKVTGTSNKACLGGIVSTSGGYFRHHWSPYSTNNPFYWLQNDKANISSITATYTVNKWYVVSIDADNGTAIVDGVTISFTPVSGSLTTGSNYGVFARLGMFQTRASAFKYLKLRRGGVLLRDFIPVRKGNVGYMYDRVSGELFGNAAASGAFAYGADVSS